MSHEGRPGAGSTQGHAPNRMSPPPLALFSRLDLLGFRALSNSDRVPVFLFVFCTCLDQAGARLGLYLARGFLRVSLAWMPSSLESIWRPDQMAARFGFVSGSRPRVFFPWSLGWTPPIRKVWAVSGSRLHLFF